MSYISSLYLKDAPERLKFFADKILKSLFSSHLTDICFFSIQIMLNIKSYLIFFDLSRYFFFNSVNLSKAVTWVLGLKACTTMFTLLIFCKLMYFPVLASLPGENLNPFHLSIFICLFFHSSLLLYPLNTVFSSSIFSSSKSFPSPHPQIHSFYFSFQKTTASHGLSTENVLARYIYVGGKES